LKVSASVKSEWGAFGSFVVTELCADTAMKRRAIRMQNAICDTSRWNPIEFYFRIPDELKNSFLKIYLRSPTFQKVTVKDFAIRIYEGEMNK